MKANEEFRTWFDRQIVRLSKPAMAMVREGKEHVPILLLYPEHKPEHMTVLSVPPNAMASGTSKEVLFSFQKKLASQSFVYAAMILAEAWHVFTKDKDNPYVQGKSLADHPDRKERLVLNALRRDMQLLALMEIDRKAKTLGKPKITDPFEDGDEGRMIARPQPRH